MKHTVTIFIAITSLLLSNCTPKKDNSMEDTLLMLLIFDYMSNNGPDPLFAYQWHLKNNGDTSGAITGADARVESVWNQNITGAGVNLVVVDDGVDLRHEDLNRNINNQLNIDFTNQLPNQVNGTATCDSGNACHGTAVAGVAGAVRNNGKGGTGAAPGVKLSGRNLLLSSNFNTNMITALTEQTSEIHISNNSWGAPDYTGDINGSLGSTNWKNAIEYGLSSGRNGKGTLYFWAAGNGGGKLNPSLPEQDNSNYDSQANFYGVLAIAALGNDDTRASYSERGANLWVSAHSEGDTKTKIVTTDISGSAGYNFKSDTNPFGTGFTENYTNLFNGTSSATPLAAGVTALVLEANPNLTWRDVKLILAKSARKVQPTDTDWITNGAGIPFNDKYGFGAIDAESAVALAKSWTNLGSEVTPALGTSSPGTIINGTSGVAVDSTINLSGTGIGKIEFVEITLSVDSGATSSGDLRVALTSPSGKVVQLASERLCFNTSTGNFAYCSDYSNWRFGVSAFLDEPANGNWKLTIRDAILADNPYGFVNGMNHTGNHIFTSWGIKVRGRAN